MRNAEPFAGPIETPETPDEFDAWYDRNPDDGDAFAREFIGNYHEEVWAAIMASPLATKVYQKLARRIEKGEAGS